MTLFVVFSKDNCPWCDKAKALLESRNQFYIYHDINDRGIRDMFKANGWKTVPQILEGDTYIGGYEQLWIRFNGEGTNEY